MVIKRNTDGSYSAQLKTLDGRCCVAEGNSWWGAWQECVALAEDLGIVWWSVK